MRKLLSIAMAMFVATSWAQISNFDNVEKQGESLEALTGNSTKSYLIMDYAAKHRVTVQRAQSDVPSDKAEVILEAHKVFGEFAKVGFQMLLDADHNVYGDLIYDWTQAYYDDYTAFEYKLPENADASEMSENIVLDGTASVQVPAGTYDFMIVYPFPGDGIMIADGHFSKCDDFEFKGGYTYRFEVVYGLWDKYGDGYLGNYPVVDLYTDIDAAITNLILPPNSMELTNNEDIEITINNRGVNAITGFTVSYRIDDNEAVTETYTGSIAAGESASYTFTTKADFSAEKQYIVEAWVTLQDDMVAVNNSTTAKCKHIGVAQLPYFNDISTAGAEALKSDWTVLNLNNDYSTWEYNEWTEGADGTQGAISCTGCYEEDRTGNDYLITVPIQLNSGDNHLIVHTKCINAEEATELLDVLYGSSTDVTKMETIASLKVESEEWIKNIVNFNVEKEGVYYFAFYCHSIEGMNLFIDDITIDAGFYEVTPFITIEDVILPYSNCDLSDQSTVGAIVKNTGTGTSSSFTLRYTVDSNEPVSQKFDVALAPNESTTLYFDIKADFSEIGEYNVLVEGLTNDKVEGSLTETLTNYEPATLPLTTDFANNVNYTDYWVEMTPGTWEVDDFMGTFGTDRNGLENGLLSRCFYLTTPIRVKIQYSVSGWDTSSMYIAFGKAGADVSSYERVYQDDLASEGKDIEFVIPVTEPDNYCIVIVNNSGDYCNLYLGIVTISELLANDIRLNKIIAPSSVYTPEMQINGDATFTAEVINRGSAEMTDVVATLYKDNTLLATSEQGVTIASNDTVLIPVKAHLGNHTVGNKLNFSMSVEGATTDQFADDNTLTVPTVNVTDTVYATENVEKLMEGTGNWGSTLSVGNIYEIVNPDELSSITVGWAPINSGDEIEDANMASKAVSVAVYGVNDDMTLGRQYLYIESTRGMGGFVNYTFDPIKLEAGRYFFEVQQLTTYNMGIGLEASEEAFCYQNVEGTLNYVQGANLIIRANFATNAFAPAKDAAVVGIVTPVKKATLFTANETIVARVKNAGSEDTTFDVVLNVNGKETKQQVNLLAYEVADVEFTNVDMQTVGTYDVTISALLEGDEKADNNTYSDTFESVEEANQFVMDFENCYDFDAAPDRFNPSWRTVDRVNRATDYFWAYDHPYRGEPVGFMAFNPEATTPAVNPEDLVNFTPHSGKRFGAAFCVGYDSEITQSDTWLISPKLQLGTNTSLELWVSTRLLEYGGTEEPYRILISDTDDNFESFQVVGEDTRRAPLGWTLVTEDLKQYDNKEVYIAIQYLGVQLENVVLMIDDIAIKGEGLGNVENTTLNDTYIRYYNSEEVLSIQAQEIAGVEIFNAQGTTVYAAQVNNAAEYRVSTRALTNGVYIARVTTANGSTTYKFVIR